MEPLIVLTLVVLDVLIAVLLYRVVRFEQYIKSKYEPKGEPEYYDDNDPMLSAAEDLAMSNGKISAAFLQRRLGIGYARSARLLDIMEEKGIIGPANGAGIRDVVIRDLNQKVSHKVN